MKPRSSFPIKKKPILPKRLIKIKSVRPIRIKIKIPGIGKRHA